MECGNLSTNWIENHWIEFRTRFLLVTILRRKCKNRRKGLNSWKTIKTQILRNNCEKIIFSSAFFPSSSIYGRFLVEIPAKLSLQVVPIFGPQLQIDVKNSSQKSEISRFLLILLTVVNTVQRLQISNKRWYLTCFFFPVKRE